MNLKNVSRFIQALAEFRDQHGIRLDGEGTDTVTGWFLGPKGENGALLKDLAAEAVRSHMQFRHDVYPEDPKFITKEMQETDDYRKTVRFLFKEYGELLRVLQKSGAFFSMRSQGHMLWDVTIPGLAGYFAAMLYNQNNVAAEASPVTTMMEVAVGDDLCRMLGYYVPVDESESVSPTGRPRAWGHITCDGSIANMEGLWMARNLKFYPPALLATAEQVPAAAPVRDLEVRLLDGSTKRLADCSAWELVNLPVETVVNLPSEVQAQCNIDPAALADSMAPYTVSALGMAGACSEYLFKKGLGALPIMTVPTTKHYSWPKGAALLGLGTNQMREVHVDLDARQIVDRANQHPGNKHSLRAYLQQALDTRTPVLMVVSVMGSTEESAVDPLDEILALRDEFRDRGLEFTVHADAAWGGYFASTLRERLPEPEPMLLQAPRALRSQAVVLPPIPETPMNADILRRYAALGQADSITVDPHKAGYIPYPAGGLCYRDSNMRNLVSLKSPVVFHGQADPTVGVYGIEGSKPGAAAAAVYMSHKVIRPTRRGYGKLMEQCIFSSKKLYARIRTMARPTDPFRIAMVQRIPAEKENRGPKEIEKQLAEIREWFVGKSNQAIVTGPHYEFFRQLGSDQTIFTYAFNFKNADGTWNQDLTKLNALNNDLYLAFSMMPTDDGSGVVLRNPSDVKLIVTSSAFGLGDYGPAFVLAFLHRLGIDVPKDQVAGLPPINFLISTQMDPWFTEDENNPQDGFLATIEETLRAELLRLIPPLQAAAATPQAACD
jgi:glutamate/tyrosine decarboxylase-like PLP-dependent enzyme